MCDKSPSPATITTWINGDKNGKRTEPKVLGLKTVAEKLGVSVDYLLGLSPVKTPNMNKRGINKVLGLSSEAIDVISNFDSEKQKTFSTIIENDKFKEILSGINDLINQKILYNQFTLEAVEKINKANENAMYEIVSEFIGIGSVRDEISNAAHATNAKVIDASEYMDVLRYRLKNSFEDIVNDVTFVKDFNPNIFTSLIQLIAVDDNDPLYKVKIDILKMAQRGNIKKFMKKNLKNNGWSKA